MSGEPEVDELTAADVDLSRHEPGVPTEVEIYDTTLRDGSQLEGISLTVDDKLRIAEQLDLALVDRAEIGSGAVALTYQPRRGSA